MESVLLIGVQVKLTSWGGSQAACMKALRSGFPCVVAPFCQKPSFISLQIYIDKQFLKIGSKVQFNHQLNL